MKLPRDVPALHSAFRTPHSEPNRIPGATYRLQFNAGFTLEQAREIVGYLHDLGVTDVYASPLLQASPGSTHGYDTCSHSRMGESLGGEQAFQEFSTDLRKRGMGLLLDIVPNHMAAHESNAWWWDVLKHGRASKFARFFDIDWERGQDRVILPILGKESEKIVADRQLDFSTDGRDFLLNYFTRALPLNAKSPATSRLLEFQAYKLVPWWCGPAEVNYRRFFDVNELVALRMEEARVFHETHRRVMKLVRSGVVTGLRIDHPDGLRDPVQYFKRLQSRASRSGRRLYVVAEKILSRDERLPADWPVAGTTGYDFLNDVNGLFVAASNEPLMTRAYHEFTNCAEDFEDLAYRSKKRVLHKSFIGDVQALARRLDGIADVPFERLCHALIELIACFPIYRTYACAATRQLASDDETWVRRALASARQRSTEFARELDRIEEVLLHPERNADTREFVLRFQQLTGPAAAKGIEDTAFYRFNRLVSLNEVGGDPGRFGVSIERFHERNTERAKHWPHTLLATSTHDTKRGEDTRARINVLSEIPDEWRAAAFRWRELNAGHKTDVNGAPAPDANDEYLLYQTLIGTWPPSLVERPPRALGKSDGDLQISFVQNYGERIAQFMQKAIKEAKRHTSWTEPNEAYERATRDFVARVLDSRNQPFLNDFVDFQRQVAFFGVFNSLSQTVLKLTSPGVPDIYQGSELWDFSLVDPDNRRAVDYARRRTLLEKASGLDTPPGTTHSADGMPKLFLIQRTLRFRNANRELFDFGEYIPLEVRGARRQHICAFARRTDLAAALVVVPRFLCALMRGREASQLVREVWDDTEIVVPRSMRWGGKWRNALTGERVTGEDALRVDELLGKFPVALMAAG